jgi:pyrroline-5-carboxylate reductase
VAQQKPIVNAYCSIFSFCEDSGHSPPLWQSFMTDHISSCSLVFVGGGNMAGAIMGGLVRQGHAVEDMGVVEPWAEQRTRLAGQFPGLTIWEQAGPALSTAQTVVWAVKPQVMKEAAQACQEHTRHALHLSVAAGITTDSLAQWLGTERLVRAMPNTPALVGLGMTGLFARSGATPDDVSRAEALLRTTGDVVWVQQEAHLDAVTALSGSGPAYVFYFLEAMRDAGQAMGLDPDTAYQLAVGTFVGASTLAQRSEDPPQTLRERVTSKGGTTYAALTTLNTLEVGAHFQQALEAARQRAQELGVEFGK